MEITNEIKAKVFAQYFGQEYKSESLDKLWGIEKRIFNDGGALNLITKSNIKSDLILVLKPLSAITDKDAIEIAKISGFNYRIETEQFELSGALYSDFHDIPMAYQHLQSKGYDLPNYLLNGKTLQEVGLAIYE